VPGGSASPTAANWGLLQATTGPPYCIYIMGNVYSMYQIEYMNFLMLFGGLVLAEIGNPFPLPRQLITPQKSGQILCI